MVKSKLKIKSIFMPLLLVVALVLLASATLVLGISTLPKEQYISELTNIDPIATYEKTYCEELMSYKLDKNYICSFTKELYDFSGAANYMLCYDDNLNWYAIINRESGDVLERKESTSPYNDYLQSICYYLGYGNYFYLEGDRIISISDETLIFDVNNLPVALVEDSIKLNEKAISEGTFKSRNEIETFVKEQESSVISLCGASNRSNTVYCENTWYFVTLINAYMERYVYGSLDGVSKQMGVYSFTDYYGDNYEDLLFPINFKGRCGIVAATMLLQYYERNGIVKVIPDSIYSNCYSSINRIYLNDDINNTVAQRINNEINARHSEVSGGSTYVSIKNAINAFCDDYGYYNLGATSSITDVSVKSAINNGDPAIVFTNTVAKGYAAYLNSSTYEQKDVDMHALLAYGYTKTWLGAVDEYICNAGWYEDYGNGYTNSIMFVSKYNIVGNVRFLY